MRIHNDAIATTATSQSVAAELAPGEASRSKTSPTSTTGADQVELSSFSAKVAESNSALAAAHAARVQHLAQVYAAGRYHVDAAQLSRAMVSRSLDAGLTEGESQ
jgi:anti-sigma28 factor (negative regulator of flagellin synthesis)